MSTSTTVVVTIAPEARSFVDRVGQREDLEKMIDQARHVVPGLRSIEVALDEATEETPPGVVLWTHREDIELGNDPTHRNWIDWMAATFPPDVCRISRCWPSITTMHGRALLDVAHDLADGPGEAHWRSSVGRAYYALLHEVLGTLQHWGFSLPPRDKVHTFARLKLLYATDPDLKRIGLTLEALGRLRNAADYQLSLSGPFLSSRIAVSGLGRRRGRRRLAYALEADPARRAVAVASIPP